MTMKMIRAMLKGVGCIASVTFVRGHWSESTAGPGYQEVWKVLPGFGSVVVLLDPDIHRVNRHKFQVKGQVWTEPWVPER